MNQLELHGGCHQDVRTHWLEKHTAKDKGTQEAASEEAKVETQGTAKEICSFHQVMSPLWDVCSRTVDFAWRQWQAGPVVPAI
jgi:hypothetical protein